MKKCLCFLAHAWDVSSLASSVDRKTGSKLYCFDEFLVCFWYGINLEDHSVLFYALLLSLRFCEFNATPERGFERFDDQ